MEGTRRCVFLEDIGGRVAEHVVYCIRKDSPGTEVEFGGGVEGGLGRTELKFREDSVVRTPTTEWSVIDDRGQRYKVEDVREVNSGPRSRWLAAVCERL